MWLARPALVCRVMWQVARVCCTGACHRVPMSGGVLHQCKGPRDHVSALVARVQGTCWQGEGAIRAARARGRAFVRGDRARARGGSHQHDRVAARRARLTERHSLG